MTYPYTFSVSYKGKRVAPPTPMSIVFTTVVLIHAILLTCVFITHASNLIHSMSVHTPPQVVVAELPIPQKEPVVEEVLPVEPVAIEPEQPIVEEIDIVEVTPVEETVVKEVVSEPEVIIEATKTELKQDAKPVGKFTHDSSVKGASGLTAEMIDQLYAGTPLEGLGYAFKDIEDQYNINAYFSMSVAALESGRGKSQRAQNKNDYFGMMGTSYDTRDGSIYAFGRLMKNYEEKHNITMTPRGINPRYCETDSWYISVTQIMNDYARKAAELS